MSGVHEGTVATGADEEAADVGQRFLRRAQTDALIRAGERLEPFEGKGQMRAALVAKHGVNLVHDDRADCPQHLPPRVAREQDVQRLRRRDEHVRGRSCHTSPLALGRVT